MRLRLRAETCEAPPPRATKHRIQRSTGVRTAHTKMTMDHASEIGPKKPLSPSSAAP